MGYTPYPYAIFATERIPVTETVTHFSTDRMCKILKLYYYIHRRHYTCKRHK